MLSLLLPQANLSSVARASQSTGLRNVFENMFSMGVMIEPEIYVRENKKALSAVTTNFDVVTTENVFKWENIHPSEDLWIWTYADRFVEFAKRNGLQAVGHPLVWHSQIPDSVWIDGSGKRAGRSVLQHRLDSHVATLADRYRGKLKAWDAVNEVIDDNGRWVNNLWFDVLGSDYVERAFHVAREADPDAVLIYNDYNLWHPAKREAVFSILSRMIKKGVPIDAVGIQGHVGLDYPDMYELDQCLQAFKELGLRIYISELDVDVLPPPRNNPLNKYQAALDPYKEGLPDTISDELTKRYVELFNLFMAYADDIEQVTLWGLADHSSWRNDFPVKGRTNYPLLFDRDYNPKPPYFALKKINL